MQVNRRTSTPDTSGTNMKREVVTGEDDMP